MRWTRGYQSDDVEVRKGNGATGGGGMGSGMLGGILSLVVSRFGIVGGIVVVGLFLVFNLFFSGSPSNAVDPSADAPAQVGAKQADPRVEFASFVLDDVQKTWARRFAEQNGRYPHARLVIFTGGTSTGCGYGQSATGPFYCPRDQQVYLDLDFFKTLEQRLGARGDFAQAYVIAHEIGHHVQNQLGLTRNLGAGHTEGANGSSVKTELQADCLAGIWAHDTANRDILEKGDIEEALTAAASIGDDRLQRMGRGTVQPESWTHGSSAQRVFWFKRGYESGKLDSCDTSETAQR